MRVARYTERALTRTSAARVGGSMLVDQLADEAQPKKQRCTLFTGSPDEPNNFSANVSTTLRLPNRAGYVRHRHDFDQLRLTLRGNIDWGPGTWAPAGCIHYTPAGTYYGPIHQNDELGFETLTVRFEGSNGHVDDVVSDEASDVDINAARDRLVQRGGTFDKNGIYSWVDEHGKRHNKDAYEACTEEVFGHPIRYPISAYTKPIVIDPAGFDWAPLGPHASTRRLGTFTAGETRMEMIRVRGGAHSVAAGDQRTLLFVVAGEGTVDGESVGARDGVLLERGEQVRVSSDSEIELFALAMPKVPG